MAEASRLARDGAVRAAILDADPVFSRGLRAMLEDAGFRVDEPSDLTDWLRARGRRVAIIAWPPSFLPPSRFAGVMVALLSDAGVDTYRGAFHAGASACVLRTAVPNALIPAVADALAGHTRIPTATLHALTQPETPPEWLTDEHIALLRQLALGTTYDLLASQHHVSSRTMFRRIHDLFDRMGSADRVSALVRAARWGVLS